MTMSLAAINALKERRNRIIVEATKLVEAGLTEETRSKFDAMYADADIIKADIDRAERVLAVENELRSLENVPAPGFESSSASERASADKEQRQSEVFSKFLRSGERRMSAEEIGILSELRDLSTSTGSAGAFTIAPAFSNKLEAALKFFGGMRKVASSFVTTTGATLPWPTENDTANMGGRLGAETVPGTADPLDLTFGVVNFGSYTYTTHYINVPNELLQDSAFNLEALIQDRFVKRIGRIQNKEFTIGTGTNQPKGVITAASVGVTAATGGATSATYANLVDLTHSVDVEYRDGAQFMFNDLTLGALRKLVDTQGRALLGLGINGGDPDKILGYGYVVNNDISVMAANAKSIAFGQLNKYQIRDVKGLSIMRLTELNALRNMTTFVGFSRADGQLLDAGTGPVKLFVNSAT
jgi:HK97 family phage major capsid protein